MRDVLLVAILLGWLPIALFNPFAGVMLWTWLSVMNPHRLTFGFAWALPAAQAAAIATLIGLVVAHKTVRFPFTPLTKTLLAFILWMNVTMIFAIHPDLSVEQWSRVMKTLLMTLVALAVVRSEKQLRIFLWIFVMSVAFFGVKGGVFAILTGGEFRVYGPPNSQIEDNNEISVALVMMIPLMAFLQSQARHMLVKVGLFAAIILCGVSVVASYSRGASVSGCAMLLVLAIKSRQRARLMALLAISIPLILVSVPQKWWDRMDTITIDNPDQSIQGRFNAWQMCWNLALDRPVYGGGFAIYQPDVFAKYAPDPLDLHSAHSIYFQMLGEHGFVGLGIYLLIALLMWVTAGRVIRASSDTESRWRAGMARALQISMVGFLVGGLTVNIGYWDVYYFELVMIVALRELCREREPAPTLGAVGPALAR